MQFFKMSIISSLLCTVIAMAGAAWAETEQADRGRADKADFSMGVSLDFAWWNPVWGRINQAGDMLVYYLLNRSVPFFKIERRFREYSVDPFLTYGLHFQAEFPNGWGVSADAAAGTCRDASVMVASLTTNAFAPSEYLKYRIDTVNFEGSVNIRYRFADWFRLLFGPVYQGYILKDSNTSYLSSQSYKETTHMIGFNAGGSFDIRLAENLYLRPAASFLYLYGFVGGSSGLSQRSNSNALGVSSAVSLAYYIEKFHVTLSLGFRYQGLYYLQVSNPDYLNTWDHRYGITESITCTF